MSTMVHPGRLTEATLRAAVQLEQRVAVFGESSSAMLFLTQAIREMNIALYARISTHYGSMGHALAGAIGFCAATGMRAIVLTGDGSLQLMNPLPTAVKHDLRLTLVVFNNGLLGLPHIGCAKVGANGAQTTTLLEPWDFTATGSPRIGVRQVTRDDELDGALTQAVGGSGCFVLDARTDPSVEPPAGERFDSVSAMLGVTGGRTASTGSKARLRLWRR